MKCSTPARSIASAVRVRIPEKAKHVTGASLRDLSNSDLDRLGAQLTDEWRWGLLTEERCRLALRVTGEATRRLEARRAS